MAKAHSGGAAGGYVLFVGVALLAVLWQFIVAAVFIWLLVHAIQYVLDENERNKLPVPPPVVEPWPELAAEPRPKARPAPDYLHRWDGTRKWMAGERLNEWDGLFEETLKASPRLSFMVTPDGDVIPPER